MLGTAPGHRSALVLAIVACWLASVGVRWWTYDTRPVPVNVSASYHVLLTVEAMDRTPASIHHFLPILSLNRPLDRGVQYGASIAGPDGIYYYTSFSSVGFLAPWAFFKLTRIPPTLLGLAAFNVLLHLATTLLLALLVWETLAEVDDTTRRVAVMLSAITCLFAREALYSQGIVYWHHSLFQMIWAAQLVALGRALRGAEKRRDLALLIATSFLGPLVEWTGFFATAAAGLVLVRSRRSWRLTILMAISAMLAIVVYVGQLVTVFDLKTLLASMGDRAAARSSVHGSASALARGYVDSFGLPLLGFAGLLSTALIVLRSRLGWRGLLLIAIVAPMIENVFLAAHATDYSFDRLKALIVVVMVISIGLTVLTPVLRERAVYVWMVVTALVVMRSPTSRFGGVVPPLSSNDALLGRLHAQARPCAVYGTDGRPGAGIELTVGANVYGEIGPDSLAALGAARGACQAVHLRTAVDAGEGLYVWRLATVRDIASGRTDTIPGTARRRPNQSIP